jgi:hypothetical protein
MCICTRSLQQPRSATEIIDVNNAAVVRAHCKVSEHVIHRLAALGLSESYPVMALNIFMDTS